MWFQNRRAKWRKNENTKKGPGRPAHNALPQTCSGDPIPAEELRRKEEQRLAKKQRRELERLERAAARKMGPKPSLSIIGPACGLSETKQVDVDGVGKPLPEVDSDLAVDTANCTDLDVSDGARNQPDVVRQVSEDRRPDVDPRCDRTGSDNRKSSPEPVIRTTRPPPDARACPFSIESLLEQRQTPGEHRANDASRSRCRTLSKQARQLQFQPVGFQVESLSLTTIPEPVSICNTLTAN